MDRICFDGPMLELNHLRYFYEVARARSFSAAARRLRISQPSLSKAVQQIELRFDVSLFERSKRGVELTPLGESVFEDCEEIFSRSRSIEQTLRNQSNELKGPFRFAASDHLANYCLPAVVRSFSEKHPKVEPKIFVGSPQLMLEELEARRIEFALFFSQIQRPFVEYKKLNSYALVNVELNSRKTKTKQALIMSMTDDYKVNPTTSILGKESDADGSVSFESNSQEFQKRLCLEGLGQVVLLKFMVEEELKSGRFRLKRDPKKPLPKASAYLAKRKDQKLSPAAEAFIAEFKDTGK